MGYALTQARRASNGWRALAGNHVMIRTDAGPVVALCHLKQGSVRVRLDQRLEVGHEVAGCGNSGNSTEPHLHLQAVSVADVGRAVAVPITFHGALPRNGSVVAAH